MSETCPSCKEPVTPSAVICLACGFNLKTGETLHTATTAEEPDDDEDDDVEEEVPLTGWERVLETLGAWVPGLFRPKVVVAAVLVAIVGLAVMALGATLFASGMVLAPLLVAVGGAVIFGQGVVWLFDGEICLLHDALTNLEGNQLFVLAICLAIPAITLFAAMDYVSQFWSIMSDVF